jgi:hypothetical protein
MARLRVNGADWDRVETALSTSFSVFELPPLVQASVPEVYGAVPWLGGADNAVHQLVDSANRHGVLDKLLAAAVAKRPHRPDLLATALYFARQPEWRAPFHADGLEAAGTLEQLTSSGDPFLDATRLAEWSTRVMPQVCAIRCGSTAGTGFLIGGNLILTNYHVVVKYLTKTVKASDVQVRFDYRTAADGSEPPYNNDWMDIDESWNSPHSNYATEDTTLQGEPPKDKLDFAILRLRAEAGKQTPKGSDHPRGWIDLSGPLPLPAAESPTLIVQHPGRDNPPPPQLPLRVAVSTPGYERLNSTGVRTIYTPSTKPGSSGSPVFDGEFKPFALHQNRGEIRPDNPKLAKNNRGIPLQAIVDALAPDVRALLISPP